MTPLAAYLLLFLAVGVGFILVHLVAGKLIRPDKQNPEKETIYECGEPTIGSAWIQFDLRFYVVALLFVIFDVEVAFFFPWAEIFGKANAIRSDVAAIKIERIEKAKTLKVQLEQAKSVAARPGATDQGKNEVEEIEAKINSLGETLPPTLEERAASAAKVNEISSPRGNVLGGSVTPGLSVPRERALWQRLEAMRSEERAAFEQLSKELIQNLHRAGERTHDSLRSLSNSEFVVVRDQSKNLQDTFNGIATGLAEQAKNTRAAINQLSEADRETLKQALKADPAPNPAALANRGAKNAAAEAPSVPFNVGGLDGLLDRMSKRPDEVVKTLKGRSLEELDRVNKMDVELVTLPPDRQKVWDKLLPKQSSAINQLANRQVAELKKAVGAVRAALVAQAGQSKELWNGVTPELLSQVAALSAEQQKALQSLTPEGVTALMRYPEMVRGAKDRADVLAWLALSEILVFFGVLLVGFAYLWKRGDLAWVRSTASEEVHREPIPVPKELQATAKSS